MAKVVKASRPHKYTKVTLTDRLDERIAELRAQYREYCSREDLKYMSAAMGRSRTTKDLQIIIALRDVLQDVGGEFVSLSDAGDNGLTRLLEPKQTIKIPAGVEEEEDVDDGV